MKLLSFSVQNYRSITKAKKLPISDLTVLIGPNNEGKSNILRSLVAALSIVETLDEASLHHGRITLWRGYEEIYAWKEDFPLSLQKAKPDGVSTFKLEFELTPEETRDFRNEVSSTLNGTLPIEISVGAKAPTFKVIKRGPGGAALSKKSGAIAKFIGKRFKLESFPTIRTATTASRIVERHVSREIRDVERTQEYKEALARVRQLQRPILEQISKGVTETLRTFLPNIQKFEIEISERDYSTKSYDLLVNDGELTKLANKGDGIQSLVALGLIRHIAEKSAGNKSLILAIEEPESHLHPKAIHQLRTVLDEISKKYQVILTTHCPLFVNRVRVRSNILVANNRAAPSKSTAEIREILGVRSADNLVNAEIALLVEGEDDRESLGAILKHKSGVLKSALESGILAIDSLNGGSNLSYKLGILRDGVTSTHVYLDHDRAGKDAIEKAEREGLISVADYNLSTMPGAAESEFEDLLLQDLYKAAVKSRFGIDLEVSQFRGSGKWSDRVKRAAQYQGKNWTEHLEKDVKWLVAGLVQQNAQGALDPQKSGSIDTLVASLESKVRVV